MARQAAVKQVLETPLPARPNGRPPGSRNKLPGEKGPKLHDYLRFRLSFQKPADFYSYLAGYPDRTGLMAYIYRLKPRIDLSLIGINENSILRTAVDAEMSEEFIAETFGRGHYLLKLNDANRPKGQTEVCKTWFELDLCEKPPQYDVRTLCLGEPKNQDEISRLLNAGVLVREPGTNAPRLRADAGPPVAPAAAAPAGDVLGAGMFGQVLLELVKRGSANPHDTVKDTIELARLLTPPAVPVLDIEAIVERVTARLTPAGKADDAFATYERMENFLSKFRGLGAPAAPGADAGGSSWAPHVPGILSQARALLPDLIQAFREMRGVPQNGVPAVRQQQQPARPVSLEERIEAVARLGFERMNEGIKGFDYAVWVWTYYPGGREVYTFLEQNGGISGLMSLIAMNPVTRPLTTDPMKRAQIEEFLQDFFEFDPSGGADASPGAPPSASAPVS